MTLAIDLEPITPSTPGEMILVGIVLVMIGVIVWRRERQNRMRVDRRAS